MNPKTLNYLAALREAGIISDDRPPVLDKGLLNANSSLLAWFATDLSKRFDHDRIQAVAVKADDASSLAHFIAQNSYTRTRSDRWKVACVPAKPVEWTHGGAGTMQMLGLASEGSVIIRKVELMFSPTHAELLVMARVLVVQDRITTGQTTRLVIDAVQRAGGMVVAVATVWNEHGLTAEALGVPKLESLINVPELTETPTS